ncbi:hypothetical protein TWF481_008246 [Arthrobotrys musiformis]|uniref:Ankyrin n=1 Tax=Arthrobotrys musiformis TaxID=47236 RepID=A0AAV9W6I8_9PEZI
MSHEDPVPEYTEGGSLEDDLRRIAEISNNTTETTHNGITPTPPPLLGSLSSISEPEINTGDPDTDDLIRRLMREDAEEENAQRGTGSSGPVPLPNVVQTFFDAIENENSELISAFIEGGFVKVDTKSRDGVTPLVAAVRANHVRIVQQLVDYGADVNEMSTETDPTAPYYRQYRHGHIIPNPYEHTMRTPLMAAAEKGHLPLVKLFVEVFHAKDDIVPPDGMIALRLAAKNGHREVVDYLPSRRTGGLQRWQFKNKNSIRRARIILLDIYWYLKIVLYEVPRFFVWSIPKHVVVLPVKRSATYLWKHKKDIAVGIKNGIVATGRGIAKYTKKAAVGTINGIKAFPAGTVRLAKATGRGIVTGAKATWKFLTVDFPKFLVKFIKGTLSFIKRAAIAIKDAIVFTAKTLKRFIVWLAKATWRLITVKLPELLDATIKWIWGAMKYVGKGIAGFFVRLASAIHTLVTKLANWVSGITWKDVLNGFLDALRFVFVGIPKMVIDGIIHTAKFVKKALKTLFGFIGECIYYIGVGIVLVVFYLPRKIFELFLELFKSIGRGFHEIAVWINPKTVG